MVADAVSLVEAMGESETWQAGVIRHRVILLGKGDVVDKKLFLALRAGLTLF